MRVYRWEETEHHYIAIVRPDRLFDLSTLSVPHPDERETRITGVHRVRGERSTYAKVYGKQKFSERLARTLCEGATELFLQQDEQDLHVLQTSA